MTIIRKILFTLCCLTFFEGAVAQKPTGHFSFIPKAGLSIANLTNNEIYYNMSDKVESKYIARFTGGVECEYQFHPILSVSLGAFYSQQGCRFNDFKETPSATDNTSIGTSHWREKLDYLQVPLLLNGYVAKDFCIKAGVEVGYLLNANLEYNETLFTHLKDGTTEVGKQQHYDFDTKDQLNSIDVAIPVGLSYCYENVVLDARYHVCLKNIYKNVDIDEKNSFFTFTVGYRL